MKAAVVRKPGGPEVLSIEDVPLPSPQLGEVLIKVKAFGLNRSELFSSTRRVPRRHIPAHPRH
jgi:NADPH:quinone reductase-like Zn-dependent oxidoreductase